MEILIYNSIGTVGVVCCTIAFLLLQTGKLLPDSFWYSFLNFLGGSGILISLSVSWNLSAALMEGIWTVISLYGLFRYYRKRTRACQKP